jgi:hypothetical protein
MDFEKYKDVIGDFYETTGIDRPPDAAIDSWFSHLSHLEIGTLSAVMEKMKTELERRPYNMLFKIKEAALIYLRENPRARKDPDYGDCDECHGEGVFFVKYAANGDSEKKNSAIVLCGSCENWRNKYGSLDGKLRMKKFEAEYHGYEVQK